MPRKHSQSPEGHEIALKVLEGEYHRASANTKRKPSVYKGFLERLDWCLSVLRKEQRESAASKKRAGDAGRKTSANGKAANGKAVTNGAPAKGGSSRAQAAA